MQAFERLVEHLEVGFGFAQRIEAFVDSAFGVGGRFELIGFELVVERPKGLAGAVQRLDVEVH